MHYPEASKKPREKNGGLPPQAPRRPQGEPSRECSSRLPLPRRDASPQEQPLVAPQVVHFMHVPLRTNVKLPHSPQESPSNPFRRALRTRSRRKDAVLE